MTTGTRHNHITQQAHRSNSVDHAGFPQPAIPPSNKLRPQPFGHDLKLLDDPRWLLHDSILTHRSLVRSAEMGRREFAYFVLLADSTSSG
jgi:hypothetical protein